MNRAYLIFVSLLLGVLFAAAGCESASDNDDGKGQGGQFNHGGEGGQAADGAKMCCQLGALCHSSTAEVSEEQDECHQLGHENDPEACAEQYEHCIAICAGLTDEPVEHACD